MVEYLGESRIDGYPIVKISKDNDGDLFLEHFRNLKNKLGVPIEIHMVSILDEHHHDNDIVVKVTLIPSTYHNEYKLWRKNIRKQKIERIDKQINKSR